jgi:GrpB-like predicted nucleotidyltransferase (UPF0157 family)
MKEQYRPKVTADDPDRQRKIQIVPYNSNWPLLFEQQAARIRDALKEAALGIEHVGSGSRAGCKTGD